MVNIEYYMNDGANWQAQAVLAYLKSLNVEIIETTWDSDLHDYKAKIEVGRYENDREQGYVFSVFFQGKQRNYAVFEHSTSDDLIIFIADGLSVDTPRADFMMTDHLLERGPLYKCFKRFEYGNIIEATKFIAEDMKLFIYNNQN